MQAVVVWTKEMKTSIEPQCHVPENSRFPGAVTPVRFSGDKKWYPAKVMALSDNPSELEKKEKEVSADIEKQKKQALLKKELGKGKRNAKKRSTGAADGAASEQDLARALGGKPPVPPHLQGVKGDAEKASKEDKRNLRKGQESLDRSIMSLKRNQISQEPQGRSQNVALNDLHVNDTEDDIGNDDSDGEEGDSSDDESSHAKDDRAETTSGHEKWCGCGPCALLQKYDDVVYHNFLTDLSKIYASKSAEAKKLLVLKAIMPGSKQTELVSGSGIYIKADAKDQIRVDFKNKPSSIIRETLYSLYGKEQFKVLSVTARGTKPGSHGLQEDVLKAIVSFVNKNVDTKKQVTLKSLVTIINKRAPEWRRSDQSPTSSKQLVSNSKRAPRPASPVSLKVVSTSPFKCTPLKSPIHCQQTPVSHVNQDISRCLFGDSAQPTAQQSSSSSNVQGPPSGQQWQGQSWAPPGEWEQQSSQGHPPYYQQYSGWPQYYNSYAPGPSHYNQSTDISNAAEAKSLTPL